MQLRFESPAGYDRGPIVSPGGLAITASLHAVVIALLASLDAPPLPPQMATLMIQLIQPQPSQTQKIVPPTPKPMARQPAPQQRPQPATQQQQLAATAASSTTSATPPEVAAPPAPDAVPLAPVATDPRFDADYLDNPAPVYPALSRRMEESGKTVLRVYVEPNGKPSQIQVRSSSGSPRLDQAAQDAVWRWKFIPARRGDEAIGAWVLVPIEFNLKG